MIAGIINLITLGLLIYMCIDISRYSKRMDRPPTEKEKEELEAYCEKYKDFKFTDITYESVKKRNEQI